MLAWLHVVVLPLLFGAAAAEYPDPEPCTGACNVRDPALIRRESDGVYFWFSSHDKIKYAASKSLSGPWTVLGSVVPNGSKIELDGRDDLWAPDVQKVRDTYFVYYAVSTLGSQTSAIGLATSKTMKLGSWTDHGSVGVESNPDKAYNAIDPNLFEDGGHLLLTFGSYWQDLFQVQMSDNGTEPISEPHQVAYEPAGNHHIEGSFLYRHGPFYYLFYSWGIGGHYDEKMPPPGQEYRIKVCRSLSPSYGFVGPSSESCTNGGGMTVLSSHGEVFGPGGQGVFTDPQYGPVLYYHYTNTSIGYSNSQQRLGWNRLDFSSGWPKF